MGPGDIIAERFELEELVAAGGMAVVYRARDRRRGAPVALKLLRDPGAELAERFAREAQVIAGLDHPRVVRYVDHGRLAAAHYLAMEWLDGETLAARLARGALGLADSVTVMTGICEALAAIHATGHLHRDVKPSNLFLRGGDLARVSILDFGLARLAGGEGLTHAGTVVGTPGFMAPEQVQSGPQSTIDERADVFAAGCVFYQCLTGRPAFRADSELALLAKILVEEPPPVRELAPELPEAVDGLVARMLAKDRARRPRDAAAVLAELEAVAAAGPPPPVLAADDQRLLCMILAAAALPAGGVDGATLPAALESGARRTLIQIADAYGARVTETARGGLLATLSGAAVATDQAARAARCALAFRDLLDGVPIAIVTGHGLLTHDVPIGAAIDRATRLTGGGARVHLDETTAALLEARFDVRRDAGGAWLEDERPDPETPRTLLGRATPFVGREQELATLVSQLDRCEADGSAGAILVTGAAGTGKSRLVQEMRGQLARRERPPQVWLASGDPTRFGSPYGLVAPAIRRLAGLGDGEPLAARHGKLRARLGHHLAGAALDRVCEAIGELVGAPFSDANSLPLRAAREDPSVRSEQVRRAWVEWLAAECAAGPLVLVLEDLHWGDLPSVQLVEAALAGLAELPFMVVALARPEVSAVFPQLWRDGGVQELRLGPLRPKACARLARAVLGAGAGDADIARLVERAGGNAFYLEELLRAFADGKSDALPPTVVAMVTARLERLEPEARRVLRAASVFGRVFWPGGIAALLGGPARAGATAGWIATLVEREVIVRRAERRFPGEEELAFRHALVGDAAYALLGEADRQLGHRLAGAWLEAAGEQDAHALAGHFERGGDRERAVACCARAAAQAVEANDFAAATAHAERGLGLGASGAARGELLLRLGEAKDWAGDFDALDRFGPEAVALLPRGSALWYRAIWKCGLNDCRRGDHERVAQLVADLGRREAEDPHALRDPAHVEAVVRTAVQLLFTGKVEQADALLGRIAPHATALAAQSPLCYAALREALGVLAMCAGEPHRSYLLLVEAATLTEAAGALSLCAGMTANAAAACVEGGRYDEAELLARRALALADRLALSNVAALAHGNLAYALAGRGAIDEALPYLERAVAAFAAQGDRRLEAAIRAGRARLHALAGRLEEAQAEAERALAVDVAPPQRALALGVLATIQLARGQAVAAAASAGRAMAIVVELGGLEEQEALVRLAHAEALHATGAVAAATAAIADARARILGRADLMTDPAWRAAFLAVPENARTLAWRP